MHVDIRWRIGVGVAWACSMCELPGLMRIARQNASGCLDLRPAETTQLLLQADLPSGLSISFVLVRTRASSGMYCHCVCHIRHNGIQDDICLFLRLAKARV
jgi:hypothetical protein